MITSVNECVLRFSNVNGTGSLRSNSLFAKALFRMGIPVGARNIYPSNIKGLPTWYEIRVSEKGHIGSRGNGADILVSVNPESLDDDLKEVRAGGYFIYDAFAELSDDKKRDDVTFISIPFTQMSKDKYEVPSLRPLLRNIIYVGALAAFIDADAKVIKQLLAEQFKGKDKLVELNQDAFDLGYNYVKENFECPLSITVKSTDKTKDKIMLGGNYAYALGAVYGGATVLTWYPIAPSTPIAENFMKLAKKYRTDSKTGKSNYAIIQSEDEISAIGGVLGAAWNGARAFTATSGPGFSLMNENMGLAYYAEIPFVLIQVQRGGPSTGLPTRTQQADILTCLYASHGDTKHVLLFPNNPKECFELTADAFDIADMLQTPVIIMSDLELSVNEHICDPLVWDDKRKYNHGKLLRGDNITDDFARYKDVDGDGIAYRTISATSENKGCYFTRGTAHDEYAKYSEKPEDYIKNVDRLKRKWETAKKYVPEPIIDLEEDMNDDAVIYFGSSSDSVYEALDMLRDENININSMRIRSVPFSDKVKEFINDHDTVFVVEQNRDAQMRTVLASELGIDPNKMKSVLSYGGAPITAEAIKKQIKEQI